MSAAEKVFSDKNLLQKIVDGLQKNVNENNLKGMFTKKRINAKRNAVRLARGKIEK